MTDHSLKPLVATVLEGGEPTALLASLNSLDREDIYGQAAVRLLFARDRWDFTPGGEHDVVLEHLFGAFEERKPLNSDEYVKTTHDIVLDLWGIDLEDPKWHTPEAPKAKKSTKKVDTVAETVAKKSRKKVTPVPMDGPEDQTRYGTLTRNDVDTTGASDRLKKVIKIQRGQ